jgi:UDP-3-O-[3-hydroxymyristoyl] N-acetylglucosamine deacetylase
VEVSAPELPALDGSSKEYVDGLTVVGQSPLGEAEIQPLFTRVFVQEERWKIAVSNGGGHWRYCFESDKWPIEQVFEVDDVVAAYANQIAPARTFGFEDEIPSIRELGLAKGLDLDKALIVGSNGYVNDARFPDELARHKLLDTIGDLYLAGVPIRFLNVVAERSGHTANVKAAAILREAVLG